MSDPLHGGMSLLGTDEWDRDVLAVEEKGTSSAHNRIHSMSRCEHVSDDTSIRTSS